MSKREIDESRKEECRRLKAIFNDKKKDLGLTQEKLAHALDMNQSSVSHYLNGVNPLNAHFASEIAQILGVPVASFSQRLAKEIEQYVEFARSLEAQAAARNADELGIGEQIRAYEANRSLRPYWTLSFGDFASDMVEAAPGSEHLDPPSPELDKLMRSAGDRLGLYSEMKILTQLDSAVPPERAEIIRQAFTGLTCHSKKLIEMFIDLCDAVHDGAITEQELDAFMTLIKGKVPKTKRERQVSIRTKAS